MFLAYPLDLLPGLMCFFCFQKWPWRCILVTPAPTSPSQMHSLRSLPTRCLSPLAHLGQMGLLSSSSNTSWVISWLSPPRNTPMCQTLPRGSPSDYPVSCSSFSKADLLVRVINEEVRHGATPVVGVRQGNLHANSLSHPFGCHYVEEWRDGVSVWSCLGLSCLPISLMLSLMPVWLVVVWALYSRVWHPLCFTDIINSPELAHQRVKDSGLHICTTSHPHCCNNGQDNWRKEAF